MPSRIQQLLEGRDDKIDYNSLIKKYPWIIEKGLRCILSPDSDGILCGLLMSHYLNWNICGFYDGKILILKKGISAKDCIFLDMEIFRKDIRSMGQHMVMFNKNNLPDNWDNFDNCIQPNNMRKYDGSHNFRLKYPLATVHLLIGILGHALNIKVTEDVIPPLLFTDGTFNVLFKYPENVLNWLKFLKAYEKESPLKTIFENEKYSVFTLMLEMDGFFRKRDMISIPRERGDRLKISNTDGSHNNLIKNEDGTYSLKEDAVNRITKFIKILSEFTGWIFKEEKWLWNNFNLYKFTKRDFKRDNLNVTNANFKNLMLRRPLSWAMTSGQNIEYSLEEPDKLP